MMRILLFLLLNFAALGLGGLFTSGGVQSDWYQNLNKAPWTPPGWVFGVAWTTIMICFSVYMSAVWNSQASAYNIFILYSVQWVLNVAWNPIFFRYQAPNAALLCIISLTVLVAYMFIQFIGTLQWQSIWMAPYLIWLCIAVSLNAYICLMNP